ncbi:MAG: hypothetical protein HY784_04960, partial [Chloroflexi bacterium]|nr:hypothetical protein [Chloroflexota bacterium]
LAVLRWMVAALLGSFGGAWRVELNLGAQGIGMLLAFYGLWIEPQRLVVTRQQLISPALPPGRTLRALHLGDLHMERWTAREGRVLAAVERLAPDVILFSGDLLNISYTGDPHAQAQAARWLNGLRAPLGVYAVIGSPAVDLPQVAADIYAQAPHVRWLRDEAVCLEGWSLSILGVHCTQNPGVDGPRLQQVAEGAPDGNFRLLLYHTPDLAPEAAAAGMDLQLSGHTHGGQMRLPLFGALFAGSIYGKRFEMGRYEVRDGRRPEDGAMTLYVTRGLGMEGLGIPRIRVLCPPEITLWEMTGGQAAHYKSNV